MKDIHPSIAEALRSDTYELIDLSVWTLAFGDAVLRFANLDYAISADVGDGSGEKRFEPLPFGRGTLDTGGDLQIDQLTLELPNAELLVQQATASERVTLDTLVLNGILDGAEVNIYQLNLRNGGVYHHSRWDVVGAPTIGRNSVGLQLQSAFGRAVRQCPATIIQNGCNNSLYDTFCGLVRATYTDTGSAAAEGSKHTLYSDLTAADYYYDLGEIVFTSGKNVGAYRTVGKYLNANGQVTWNVPLRFQVQAGDAFEIVPGCDKTWATCNTRFSNTAKFRGFPNIPKVDSMV